MKLTNRTAYDTRTLRSAICAVHKRMAARRGPLTQWRYVRVEIVYARTRRVSGCAMVGGTYMKLRLKGPRVSPVDGVKRSPVTPVALAALIEHELLHLYGFEHRDIGGGYSTGEMYDREQDAAAWAADAFGWERLPLRAKPAKAKPDLVATRHARVLEQEKAWTTKLKRAQTALRKLKAKRRYYERALAARSAKEKS